MRIGIDARFVGPEGTGLGKYTEKLILNLVLLDSRNQYFIFLKDSNWDYLALKSKNFKKVPANIPWYSIEEQLRMEQIYNSKNLDLVHITHFNAPLFYRGKFIVTVHDLIHHHFKEQSTTTRNLLFFKTKRIGYQIVIKNAIKRSQKIIVPSNFVKEEIFSNFKVKPAKIVVTYEAAEEEYSKNWKLESEVLLRKIGNWKLPKRNPFLVYVGNAYPHKNLNNLLDAFKLLVDSSQSAVHRLKKTVNSEPTTDNLRLIIVCPRDIFSQRLQSEIKNRNLEDKVEIKGYLKPDELSKLFQKAQAYVFPSLSEGFGIPGLNAMAAGLPVVCSDIPVLHEVYGEAAIYFNPHDPKDIAGKIKKVLTSDTGSELVKKGREQVKKYSWQKMAQETLEVYEST